MDADLVSVFETTEAGLLPLARMALEQEGIDYAVQNRGFADQILGHRSSMTVGETDPPLVVVVRPEDAARAREILRDLTTQSGESTTMPRAAAAPVAATGMTEAGTSGSVELTDAESGARLGTLTPAQFDTLAAHLEVESTRDDDYFINEATVAMLEERGADPAAVSLLRQALHGRPDVSIRWRR
jgi:hypothetical protein